MGCHSFRRGCDCIVEPRTTPESVHAVDLVTNEEGLLSMYCDGIVNTRSIGIYDGAYKAVALATGAEWYPDWTSAR